MPMGATGAYTCCGLSTGGGMTIGFWGGAATGESSRPVGESNVTPLGEGGWLRGGGGHCCCCGGLAVRRARSSGSSLSCRSMMVDVAGEVIFDMFMNSMK